MKTRVSFLISLLATGAAVAVVSPVRPVVVVGESMAPTYHDGEVLSTSRPDGEFRAGDVVVVRTPTGTFIKRVALVAGDSLVQMSRPEGWLDLVEVMPSHPVFPPAFRVVRIPEGRVYLLGDNMSNSVDSREFGTVPVEWIERRVTDVRSPEPGTARVYAQFRKGPNRP